MTAETYNATVHGIFAKVVGEVVTAPVFTSSYARPAHTTFLMQTVTNSDERRIEDIEVAVRGPSAHAAAQLKPGDRIRVGGYLHLHSRADTELGICIGARYVELQDAPAGGGRE